MINNSKYIKKLSTVKKQISPLQGTMSERREATRLVLHHCLSLLFCVLFYCLKGSPLFLFPHSLIPPRLSLPLNHSLPLSLIIFLKSNENYHLQAMYISLHNVTYVQQFTQILFYIEINLQFQVLRPGQTLAPNESFLLGLVWQFSKCQSMIREGRQSMICEGQMSMRRLTLFLHSSQYFFMHLHTPVV